MCVILLGILFAFNLKNWKPDTINPLSMVYIITMFSLLCDIVWGVVDGIPKFVFLNKLVNTAYLCALSFIGWCWFEYVKGQIPSRISDNKLFRRLTLVPPVLMVAVLIISWKTGWIFYVDDAGVYHRGTLFFIQPIVAYIYLLAASVISLIACSRATLLCDRRKYLAFGLFVLPSMILNLVQGMLPPGLPSTYFGILMSLFIVFIVTQEEKITRDALTQLPNRYTFDRLLYEKMTKHDKSGRDGLYLIIADVDDFKRINDTFGHTVGDRALRMTADVFRRVAERFDASAARLGGDEFVVLMDVISPESVDRFCSEIADGLSFASKDEMFDLAVSIGKAEYDGMMSATQLIDNADKMLYSTKTERKVKKRREDAI